MKLSQMYPSKWLKSSDIKGKAVSVRIDRVESEDIGDETKNVVYFIGKDKGMVLNVTNGRMIGDAYGDETDDWHGKPIVLYVDRVMFQGKMTDGLRVRIPSEDTPAPKPPPTPPPMGDDDIPF